MKTRRASTKRTRSKKTRSSSQSVSLPELRAGLYHLNCYGNAALKRSSSLRQAAIDFSKEWQAVFGKKLPLKSAMDYLKHSVMSYNGCRTKKKQRGGVADMGYTMRAGSTAPYGAWPKYVSGGFVNAEPSMGCGAKQSGGSIFGSIANTIGDTIGKFTNTTGQVIFHPQSTNPTSVYRDAITSYNGQRLGPGGDPTTRAYSYNAPPYATNMASLIKAGQTVQFG